MGLNAFIFNGESSADHGVIITQGASYNAPARAVEMVSIPGRNGAYVRDMGRYENVEGTYRVALAGRKHDDFASALAYLRSWLCAKTGYCRLSDTYNPDEYRLAIYKSGLEIEEAYYNGAEFDIVFECKPQRFLVNGDVAITVEDGEELYNPTPFDAQPMIMTEGYGTLVMNGYEIEITNETLGTVVLAYSGYNSPVRFDSNLVKTGDTFVIGYADFSTAIKASSLPAGQSVTDVTIASSSGDGSCFITSSGNDSTMFAAFTNESFTVGTSKSLTNRMTVEITLSGGTSGQATIQSTIAYDGTNKLSYSQVISGSGWQVYLEEFARSTGDITAESTVSTLGNPTYIDCELGEVYKIESGSLISLNRLTDLGSNLPVLSPGENEITFDNTFTSVEIIPHWWVV